MNVPAPLTCAACGKPIRSKKKAITVKVWETEEVSAVVCSKSCREAYSAGTLGTDTDSQKLSRVEILATIVLGLNGATELARALMSRWWSDPLSMIVPWPVHLVTAAILIFLAISLVRRRAAASFAAIVISSLTAIAHLSVVFGAKNILALLVPASLTAPICLLLIGRPRITRQAGAVVLAAWLPLFTMYSLGRQIVEHFDSIERIERVALEGDTASSGPGGVTMKLAAGWRALEKNNGIVDWPHSELELIHLRSGAAAFAALNPDCDRKALPRFQDRSLEALAQAGGNPVPIGSVRIGDKLMELRVKIRRGGLELQSYDLFSVLPPVKSSSTPGCLWLHCLAPARYRDMVRGHCREMIGTVTHVPSR